MDRQLVDYLPSVVRHTKEMKAITELAEQPEFSFLIDAVEDILNDQFVMDATENGVSRWEYIMKIKPKATDSLGARRFRIMARLNESLPFTIRALEHMLTALCGENGYEISLANDIYTLFVKVDLTAKSYYDEVEALLHRIVPANMVIALSLKYNTHSVLKGFTHRELSKYTHRQLRNEVLLHG